MITHIPTCQRSVLGGRRWHSAVCESRGANYAYALRWGARYADAITLLLFGRKPR